MVDRPNAGGCEAYEAELLLYHYGELAPDRSALLERHLERCGACRCALEQVRETLETLDRLPLPLPSETEWCELELELNARLAPLRQARERERFEPRAVRGTWRLRRSVVVAAALLIALLGALGYLLHRVEHQRRQIGALLADVGELSFEVGDVGRAERAFHMLMITAPERDRARARLDALVRLGSEPEPVHLYRLALMAEGDAVRKRLETLLREYPSHPLAYEAFNKLLERGVPRLRPLVLAALKPIEALGRARAAHDRRAYEREELGRLERIAEREQGLVRAYALFRAGELAELRLGDPVRAREAYEQVLALEDECELGAIAEAARNGLVRLEGGSVHPNGAQ